MPAIMSISAKRCQVVVLHCQRHLISRILEFKNGIDLSIKTGSTNKILIRGGLFRIKMSSDSPKTSLWLRQGWLERVCDASQ